MPEVDQPSEAKSTLEYAIQSAITQNYHKKNDADWMKVTRNQLLKDLFEPHIQWAVKEYLEETWGS